MGVFFLKMSYRNYKIKIPQRTLRRWKARLKGSQPISGKTISSKKENIDENTSNESLINDSNLLHKPSTSGQHCFAGAIINDSKKVQSHEDKELSSFAKYLSNSECSNFILDSEVEETVNEHQMLDDYEHLCRPNNDGQILSSEASTSDTDESLSEAKSENLGEGQDLRGFHPKHLCLMLKIIATKVKYGLTYEAITGIIQLLPALGGPQINRCNKYYIKKIIGKFSYTMTHLYICDACHSYGGIITEDKNCRFCEKDVISSKVLGKGNVFIYLSLAEQLCDLLRYHKNLFMEKKQKRSTLSDIQDGKFYPSNDDEDLISINFSLDGVPVFESSNFSIWPLLVTVNELLPKERKNHVLLCSLWFGDKKPNMNQYLRPFVEECKKLSSEGLLYVAENEVQLKKSFRVLVCLSDSIARPMLQCSTQFNGKYGCSFCLHPGVAIQKGTSRMRVYTHTEVKLRSHQETIYHGETSLKNGTKFFGMKGVSILTEIPDFDIVKSLDVDWMHCVALGVCRKFANLWFDSMNHDKHFYMGKYLNEIDNKLLISKPTSEVSRTPRKMSERCHWKAHECVIWLLFYSIPAMLGSFPKEIVYHWSLLVDAVSILTGTELLKSDIYYAEKLIVEFVKEVNSFYGEAYVSFNVHLLTHLPQSVSYWGPLFSHSCFTFENYYMELLKSIKSSNGVPLQICNSFRMKFVVERLKYICRDFLSEDKSNFLRKLEKQEFSYTLVIDDIFLIGSGKIGTLCQEYFLALMRIFVPVNRGDEIQSFDRAVTKGYLFETKKYSRKSKRVNWLVHLENNFCFSMEDIIVTPDRSRSTKTCYAIGYYYVKIEKPLIPFRRLKNLCVLNKISDSLAAVPFHLIKEKVLIEMNSECTLAGIFQNHYEVLK